MSLYTFPFRGQIERNYCVQLFNTTSALTKDIQFAHVREEKADSCPGLEVKLGHVQHAQTVQ